MFMEEHHKALPGWVCACVAVGYIACIVLALVGVRLLG